MSDEQQQLVARVILSDLQRREKRLRQASGYFGCGASYLILTLALIGICIWRPEGWLVAAGILVVIGLALRVELRGVNRRLDALVEMQLKFEDEMKNAQQVVAPNRSLAPTLNSTSSVRGSED